jgi:hypothetical protein
LIESIHLLLLQSIERNLDLQKKDDAEEVAPVLQTGTDFQDVLRDLLSLGWQCLVVQGVTSSPTLATLPSPSSHEQDPLSWAPMLVDYLRHAVLLDYRDTESVSANRTMSESRLQLIIEVEQTIRRYHEQIEPFYTHTLSSTQRKQREQEQRRRRQEVESNSRIPRQKLLQQVTRCAIYTCLYICFYFYSTAAMD